MPSGVQEDYFLRAKLNYQVEESFRAVVEENSWDFKSALTRLFASLIRLQYEGQNVWVSSFTSAHLNAIVSDWNWTDFIPWISVEDVAQVRCGAAEMALLLCLILDRDWIEAEILSDLWSCLAATEAQKASQNRIQTGAEVARPEPIVEEGEFERNINFHRLF